MTGYVKQKYKKVKKAVKTKKKSTRQYSRGPKKAYAKGGYYQVVQTRRYYYKSSQFIGT